MPTPRATILTIGTEITDGQITDTNSHWISQQLQVLQIPVHQHVSVPDHAKTVREAIDFASSHSTLIFICGGLGPTVDDFTRDIVADHFRLSLQLDPFSWEEIQDKLKSRSVHVREGHQRQALFPSGAQPLKNPVGIAPGFYLKERKHHLWVLPGPPRELQGVWQESLPKQLEPFRPKKPENHLRTWLCLGIGESELAHLTETHFDSMAFSKRYGYRIEYPYVEVKVWLDEVTETQQQALKKFEEIIAPYFVCTQRRDLWTRVLETNAKRNKIFIDDYLTNGSLTATFKEIQDFARKEQLAQPSIEIRTHWDSEDPSNFWSNEPSTQVHLFSNEGPQLEIFRAGQIKKISTEDLSMRTTHYQKAVLIERLLLELSTHE